MASGGALGEVVRWDETLETPFLSDVSMDLAWKNLRWEPS